MGFFYKLTDPITSEKLERKGQKLYKLGKVFMFAGVCGLGLLLLISLVVIVVVGPYACFSSLFNYVLVLNADAGQGGAYVLVNVLVFVSYLGLLLGIVGIPMYTSGLKFFALGRIAHNTEKI